MPKMLDRLFSLIENHISPWLAIPIGFLFAIPTSTLVFDLGSWLPKGILNMITILPQPKTNLTLILWLLSILSCYVLLYLTFSKKPKLKNYELDLYHGYYKHKNKSGFYCYKCLHDGKEHHLHAIDANSMECLYCKNTFTSSFKIMESDEMLSRSWDQANH